MSSFDDQVLEILKCCPLLTHDLWLIPPPQKKKNNQGSCTYYREATCQIWELLMIPFLRISCLKDNASHTYTHPLTPTWLHSLLASLRQNVPKQWQTFKLERSFSPLEICVNHRHKNYFNFYGVNTPSDTFTLIAPPLSKGCTSAENCCFGIEWAIIYNIYYDLGNFGSFSSDTKI